MPLAPKYEFVGANATSLPTAEAKPLPSVTAVPKKTKAGADPDIDLDDISGPNAQFMPPKSCNDAIWAFAFLANVAIVFLLALGRGLPEIQRLMGPNKILVEDDDFDDDAGPVEPPETGACIISVLIALVLGGCGAVFLLRFALSKPTELIQFGLWSLVSMLFLLACITLMAGDFVSSLILVVITALNVCFALSVQDRIPFAAANLECGTKAIGKHQGTVLVSLLSLPVQAIWVVLWVVAIIGVSMKNHNSRQSSGGGCYTYLNTTELEETGERTYFCTCAGAYSSEGECDVDDFSATELKMNGCAYLLLLLCYYWGSQVIMNVVYVSCAGTVAAWWFGKDVDEAGEDASPVGKAFQRAMGPSFGSICLGSLIVALLRTARAAIQMARDAAMRRNDQGQNCMLCLFECIIGCIESLTQYFNKWAYTYMAIYGDNFRNASSAAYQLLFNKRGWSSIISDTLCDTALQYACLAIAALVAMAAIITNSILQLSDGASTILLLCTVIGAFVMCASVATVLEAAVATIIVCFAEDPQSFKDTHPEDFHALMTTWRAMYGPELEACGYDAFLSGGRSTP